MNCQRCGNNEYGVLRQATIGFKFMTNLCLDCLHEWEEFIFGNPNCASFEEIQIEAMALGIKSDYDHIDRSPDIIILHREARGIRHQVYLLAKEWVGTGSKTEGKPQNAPQE